MPFISRSLQAAAAFTLLLSLAGCLEQPAVAPPLPSVQASQPIERTVTGWDTFTGRFEAVDTVEVRPRVGGSVDRVAFRDGSIVRKGDLLFAIDARPYQAAVTQAEGQLAQARSAVVLGNLELDRARKLIVTHAIAQSVLDQREQTQQAAAAAVTMAEGALERAKLDLAFTQVRAPIAGRISNKRVSEGNLVVGGDAGATLLTTIVSLDPIDVYFDIDEESYLRYGRLVRKGENGAGTALGGNVKIALPGDTAATIDGRLDFVDNRLDGSTGTLRARARVANADHTLNPGQFGRVSIVGAAPHRALLVPAAAVTSDATQQVLYVVGADDRIVARPVVLGRLFGKLREITAGLDATDRVVVSGLQRAQPGAKVAVQTHSLDPTQYAFAGGSL